MKQGKKVPIQLLQQIEQDRIKESKSDEYNNLNTETSCDSMMCAKEMIYQSRMQKPSIVNHPPNSSAHLFSKKYLQQQQQRFGTRATASARIGLGGVF
jgi:hypothetical protein